nr:atp-dependent 6-phosphofructokinase 3 [Quercus suber]
MCKEMVNPSLIQTVIPRWMMINTMNLDQKLARKISSRLFQPSSKRLRNNVLAKDEVESQKSHWLLMESVNDHHCILINGFIALYANFDEDLCLIPESPFYLEGVGGEFGNKLHQDVTYES